MVIRMVLVGESGIGKSNAGNSILGKYVFPVSNKSGIATTRCCSAGETTRFGTKFVVVDTPGYFDGNDIDGEIKKTVKRCVELTHPGPQIFVFVFSCSSRYCENDIYVINMFKDYFGEEMYQHAVILFTQKNSKLCKGSITKFLRSSPRELREFIELCGNRVTAIDNASPTEIEVDVRKFISIVVDLVNDRNLRHINFDSVNNNNVPEQVVPTSNTDIYHNCSSSNSTADGAQKDNTQSKESVSNLSDQVNWCQTSEITAGATGHQTFGISEYSGDNDRTENTEDAKRCLWYDCSDELMKQQITVLRGELLEMGHLNTTLTEEMKLRSSSAENGDVAWCRLADDCTSLVTQFSQCMNDIFRDDSYLLSSSIKTNRSLNRRGAVRISKHQPS